MIGFVPEGAIELPNPLNNELSYFARVRHDVSLSHTVHISKRLN